MFSLLDAGIPSTAIVVAIIFKNFLFKGEDIPFVMELPPYRIPTIRSTFRHMWHKGSQYLQKMGGVILVAVIIIWALEYYPQNKELIQKYDEQIEQVQKEYALMLQDNNQTITTDSIETLLQNRIQEIEYQKISERQASSFIGRIGKFIEPTIRPLGFDWKMGVSLLSGVAAKEIVVSTLGVLVQADVEEETNNTLIYKLQTETYTSGPREGEKVFTPLSAFSFILFILIYFPCVAVIAAIKKESGSWKWAAFTIFYTTGLAWIISFLFYQIGSLIIT